jgi:hypothetical protein
MSQMLEGFRDQMVRAGEINRNSVTVHELAAMEIGYREGDRRSALSPPSHDPSSVRHGADRSR